MSNSERGKPVLCRCGCKRDYRDHVCACGCEKPYDQAVREAMGGAMALNRDQAEASVEGKFLAPAIDPVDLIDVTPNMIRAVAGMIFDTALPASIAHALRGMADELEKLPDELKAS